MEVNQQENSDETSKYLRLAREAAAEKNTEDAKQFYDKVRQTDPENGEAKFFYQYYSLYEGTNGELAKRFESLAKALKSSVARVAASNDTEEDKMKAIASFVAYFCPTTDQLSDYMMNLKVGSSGNKTRVLSDNDVRSVWSNGVLGCYELGDSIIEAFPNNQRAEKMAVEAWKWGIDGQVQHKAIQFIKVDYKGKSTEEYAEKIKKIDPDYTVSGPSLAIGGVRMDQMNPKARMRLSYIFFLVFFTLGQAKKDETAKFHANQGLLLFILEAIGLASYAPLARINTVLGFAVQAAFVIFAVVFSVMGYKNVNRDKMKAIPLIGKIKLLK